MSLLSPAVLQPGDFLIRMHISNVAAMMLLIGRHLNGFEGALTCGDSGKAYDDRCIWTLRVCRSPVRISACGDALCGRYVPDSSDVITIESIATAQA